MRTTSQKGIDFIAGHEGEILRVYKDPIGLATLGVGHLLTESEKRDMPVGTKITRKQSREYLAKDLKKMERAVNAAVKVPITQNQFDALVSFTFNVGVGGLKRSSVLRQLNNRKFDAAADALLLWNRAGGRVLKGLTRRRKEERAMFLTPDKASAAPHDPSEEHKGEPTDDPTVSATQAADPKPIETTVTRKEGGVTVEATKPNQQDVNENAKINEPLPYQGVGFWAVVKRDLYAATGGNLSLAGLTEYAQQASGWPEWIIAIIQKLAVGVLIATIGYFVFRVVHYAIDTWKKSQRVRVEADAKTDINKKDITWV
jgi:lysozyme